MAINIDDVREDPDKILDEHLRELLSDSKLVIEFLKAMGVYRYEVEVDGEPVYLVRPQEEDNPMINLSKHYFKKE